MDICSTTSVSSTHGYIQSPNYPEADYSGRQRCRCRLRASSRVIVRLLDLSTATGHDTADADNCPSSSADLVRVAAAEGSISRRYCGRLESDRLPETFDTRRADAVVEFLTHGRRRARGFWLAYTSWSQVFSWLSLYNSYDVVSIFYRATLLQIAGYANSNSFCLSDRHINPLYENI